MTRLAAAGRLSRSDAAAMGVLLAVAAALRLWGLGDLGLEVDEGIQGLTVQGWLRTGLPLLPSGLVYQRAVPFSGLQAISAWALGLDEFALRLPAALFGVAAVAATFALGRALFDRRVAWVAAIFIALSAWEIELSRYARFYTAFQVAWGLAFLCLFRAAAQGAARYWWGFAAAALVAVTLHELSILLASCLVIPLLDRSAPWRTRAVALAAAVPFVGAWVAVRRGTGPFFASLAPPHGLEPLISPTPGPGVLRGFPTLALPPLESIGAGLGSQPLAFATILLIVATAAVLVLRWREAAGLRTTLLPLLALPLGAAHQFVAAALVLFVHLAVFGTSIRSLWRRALWPVHAALGLFLALWVLLLHEPLQGDSKAILLALFGFPNLLQHFVFWFALGWPFFLLGIAIAGIVMFDRYLRRGDRSNLYLLGGIVAPVSVASMYEAFFESRYVFHLYPLLALLFAWGLTRAADSLAERLVPAPRRRIAFLSLVALGFLASLDVGKRTWAPLTRTYASARDPMRSVISWPDYAGFHQDHEGPSRYVRENAGEEDRVAVIATLHQLAVYAYYLGRIDVSLGDPADVDNYRLEDGRVVDRTTGSAVVFDPEALLHHDGGGTTWLLSDDVLLSDRMTEFPAEARRKARDLGGQLAYRGRDGVTVVRRFP